MPIIAGAGRVGRSARAVARARGRVALAVFALLLAGSSGPRAWAQEAHEKPDNGVCLDCHEADEDVKSIDDLEDEVHLPSFEAGVHADTACVECHVGVTEDHSDKGEPLPEVDCADCHQDESDAFHASVHGKLFENLPERLRPRCQSCHGDAHYILPSSDEKSPLFPTHVAGTCATCHADEGMATSNGVLRVQPVAAYEASVHGRGVMEGLPTATCTDCHGSHGILPGSDPKSRVSRNAVPHTCGTCHEAIADVFASSIHGKAAAEGVREAPVCTDCHGEHRILEPGRPDSPVYATNIPKMTCGRCHADVRLTEKFGIDVGKVSAYEDSFHGLASRTGKATVANCASCHGVHDILPSSDPRSHVYPANLAQTCGSCHPGAGTVFAIGPIHVLKGDVESENAVVFYVRLLYVWLIALTIGAMVLHNGLDFYRKAVSGTTRPPTRKKERRGQRLSPAFRLAHGVLAGSFLVLVYTGFALKFPDAFWAQPLVGSEIGGDLRGWLHRIAAVTMLSAFAFHVAHLLVDRRARRCIAAMAPSRHDLEEVRDRFRWYLGRRASMPRSPSVGYPEKVEYLALVWGSFVMALTGFSLWFENWTLAYLPKWVTDLATVVHLYEAILASLAILFWHMYFVIFDPLVYPMDTSWLTGREAPGRSLERGGGEASREGPKAGPPPQS